MPLYRELVRGYEIGVPAAERPSACHASAGGRVESPRRLLRRRPRHPSSSHRFQSPQQSSHQHRADGGVRSHPTAQRRELRRRFRWARARSRNQRGAVAPGRRSRLGRAILPLRRRGARANSGRNPGTRQFGMPLSEARRNPSDATRERHRQAMLKRYRDPAERMLQGRHSAAAWARDDGARRARQAEIARAIRMRPEIDADRVRAALDQTGSVRGAARLLECDRSVFRRFPEAIAQFRGHGALRNHKVTTVRERRAVHDVYCLTVPEAGNFALEAGVFVRNCGIIVNVTPLRARMGGPRHARVLQHHAAAREDLRQRRRRAGDLLRIRRSLRNVVQGPRRQVPGTAGRDAAQDLTAPSAARETRSMQTITTIEDLRVLAQQRVPRMFYDYADSGSWTERTYRANESDFAKIRLRQRVAVNMEGRTTATKMVGVDVAMPVAIAPTGMTGMQHADGEILGAKAAEAFGIPFTLSTMSICSIEDIAANTTAPFWFQLYVMRDREFVARLIDRAKAAKCGALVLTLDLQVLGQRHKDLKNGLSAPPKLTLANIVNMMGKPRWCMGMLGTRRRQFGNIVGHVKGVADMSSLSDWTARQFDPQPELGRRRMGQAALGRQADPEGHPRRRGREARRRFRRRRADRQQPWRPPARRRVVQHRGAAGDRRRRRLADRSPLRRRHPLGPGRAEGLGARRPRHVHRPRVPLRPGRDGAGGRHARAADHPQRARPDDGLLRPHVHRERGPQHPPAGDVPDLTATSRAAPRVAPGTAMPQFATKRASMTVVAICQVAAMALWFSASAVVPALAAEFHLSAFAQATLTSGVQVGFVVGCVDQRRARACRPPRAAALLRGVGGRRRARQRAAAGRRSRVGRRRRCCASSPACAWRASTRSA